MHVKQFLAMLTVSLALVGCVSFRGGIDRLTDEDFEPQTELKATKTDVWNAVNKVLADKHIIKVSSDKAEGLIVTDYVDGGSSVSLGGSFKYRYRFNIQATTLTAKTTKLNIVGKLEYNYQRGGGGIGNAYEGWVDGTSKAPKLVTQVVNGLHKDIENTLAE